MDRSALTPEEVKILDLARQRVFQLTNSLQNLQQDVLRHDPFPPWYVRSSLRFGHSAFSLLHSAFGQKMMTGSHD